MFHTEILIKGKIGPNWTDWFEDMQILNYSPGETLLCGDLPDKSAVYGMISRMSSLGITLVSVTCEEKKQA